MSADAYSTCPRCYARANAAWEKLRGELFAAYGVVPMAEYDAMEDRLEALTKEVRVMEANDERGTLRRYEEFTLSPRGTFTVGFSAGCEVCGFAFDYGHKQEIPEADLA